MITLYMKNSGGIKMEVEKEKSSFHCFTTINVVEYFITLYNKRRKLFCPVIY